MKQLEITGKNVNLAIENGLKQLGLTLMDVDVEVLQQKGLFRPAKVRLTVTKEGEEVRKQDFIDEVKAEVAPAQKAQPKTETKREHKPQQAKKQDKGREQNKANNGKKSEKTQPKKDVAAEKKPNAPQQNGEITPSESAPKKVRQYKPVAPEQVELAKVYLEQLLKLMKIDATLEFDTTDGVININVVTEDSAVIGHRGEVLDSLSVLVKRAVEEGEDKHVPVFVDSNGYRGRREKSLVSLAHRMANKCIKQGRKVTLEPMNNSQRKIIHATLSDNEQIITKSEGVEPNRRVVIMLKKRPNRK